jgi:hypothetical protein
MVHLRVLQSRGWIICSKTLYIYLKRVICTLVRFPPQMFLHAGITRRLKFYVIFTLNMLIANQKSKTVCVHVFCTARISVPVHTWRE